MVRADTGTPAMTKARPEDRPLRRRLMWFVALYAAGALVTVTVVYGLKALVFW